MQQPLITSRETFLPVQMDVLRSYCRVLDPGDDLVLTELAMQAVELIEKMTGRALVTQTLNWTFDAFGASRSPIDDFWYSDVPYGDRYDTCIKIPRPPLVSITSLKYYDSANVQQTLVAN